jgi:hypothetical protein
VQQFSRYQVVNALARFFQLKGQPAFQLDQTVLPVTIAADATKGPFARELATQVMGRIGAAAVAGELSYAWVTPGAGVILEVQRLRISNSGAGPLTFRVAFLTSTSTAIVGPDSIAPLRNLNTEDQVNAGQRSSALAVGSHATDETFGDLDLVGLASGDETYVDFPDGCFLYGGSERVSLAVVCFSANNPLLLTVTGREWPLS